ENHTRDPDPRQNSSEFEIRVNSKVYAHCTAARIGSRVTASVTNGSERDEQDTTRRSDAGCRYLARRGEFRRKSDRSKDRAIRFSKPPVVRKKAVRRNFGRIRPDRAGTE